MDLRQSGEFSGDLFALKQSVACDRLIQVLDDINERWGANPELQTSMKALETAGAFR